ncbi:MAG: CpaF/VirB11 family protein [Clostridiales Family XIII bacterium]|jgi:pilus assembly protein CpaF|nr:CpaF/VirB11 family protein [Clostridiales Family XIII bacterium]
MDMMTFEELCSGIEAVLSDEWNDHDLGFDAVALQKRAIIGYDYESAVIKKRIGEVIAERCGDPGGSGSGHCHVPAWYESPEDAVFHEVWGLAGIAEWFGPRYKASSSAKVIGERIYFLDGGRMQLMPQTISKDRREQLIRALLLLSPEERMDRDFHEVYMLDGTRVTIFREGLAKDGQDVIIFRRYTVPSYTFEEQAVRGTIPYEAIPLFENMVRCGFNVAFCGSVRSAKTTFLSTWQSYEDPALEGVMVETDPEIPIHKLMPEAPVVQLLADGEKLTNISKNLMRSDADYFILAEARDGIALDTAVRIARKGTRRMKMTFHTRDAKSFAQDAAVEIVRSFGGDIAETAHRVAGSFDYIFHFIHLRSKNQKKLRAIFEITADDKKEIVDEICRYDADTDSWHWRHSIGAEKRRIAAEEDPGALDKMDSILKELGEVTS